VTAQHDFCVVDYIVSQHKKITLNPM